MCVGPNIRLLNERSRGAKLWGSCKDADLIKEKETDTGNVCVPKKVKLKVCALYLSMWPLLLQEPTIETFFGNPFLWISIDYVVPPYILFFQKCKKSFKPIITEKDYFSLKYWTMRPGNTTRKKGKIHKISVYEYFAEKKKKKTFHTPNVGESTWQANQDCFLVSICKAGQKSRSDWMEYYT